MYSRLFSCIGLFAVFVLFGRGVTASAHLDRSPGTVSGSNKQFPARHLRAARPRTGLVARSIDTALRHDHELHYVDDSDAGQDSLFAAQVRLSSKLPTLVLEELEHHTETIECYDSSVILTFSNLETVKLAHREFTKAERFYLITSHKGCNSDGERDVHLVSTVSLNEEINTIVLSATHMPWENTFHRIDVRFGDSADTFELRRHKDLRPRQETTSEMATSTPVTATASSNTITFPLAPTSTPGTLNVSENIASELIDTQILPPGLGLEVLTPLAPEILQSMTVNCKNCSFQGTISLFQGFFSVENTNESESAENMIAEFFTEDGYLELRADNFAAHIELESSVVPSAGLAMMEILLPSIGLPGFTIPGIATVGPLFMPVIELGAQLSAQIDFTYGFDLTIPNNSTIIINVAELANSTESGFRDASIAPLPFQASIPSVSITLTVGFLPRLLLGISVGSGSVISGSAGIGAIFGLPKLEAKISQVVDVNERCEAVNTTAAAADDDDAFDSLTLIEPSVVLDVGLIAEVDVRAGGRIDFTAQYPLLNKTFALPTACLSYDADASSYAPAAVAATVRREDAAQGSGGVRLRVGTSGLLGGLLVGMMAVMVAT